MGVTKVKAKQLEGAAGGGATILDELGDVEITNPQHNDALQYDERLLAFTNKPLPVSSGSNVTLRAPNPDNLGVGYPAIFLNNALRLADTIQGDNYVTYAAISATSKTDAEAVIFGVINITVDPRDRIRAGNYIGVYQGYWKALGEVVSMLGAGEYNYAGIALTDNVDGVVTMLVQNGFYTTPPKSPIKQP